jgi:hypothetical protein
MPPHGGQGQKKAHLQGGAKPLGGAAQHQQQPPQIQIRATTFNAAAGDEDYCMEVDSKRFIEERGKEEDLLLLQEAGTMRDGKDPPKGNILRIAKANGMRIITGQWVWIAYNPATLKPKGDPICWRVHKDSGTGHQMAQRFELIRNGERTGVNVNVVNVHAGHNATKGSMIRAKADIKRLQEKISSGLGDVTITGGDFNEMSALLGPGTIGLGFTKDLTHTIMGDNDKIGAQWMPVAPGMRGMRVLSAKSTVLDSFGSDHCPVQLTVKIA